ncbi:hypothetical protein BC826DRAFT_1172910 [Russula brevipes]|nr:hypothetical protein BC826DRAFT_1172910 [Russula brevipes]
MSDVKRVSFMLCSSITKFEINVRKQQGSHMQVAIHMRALLLPSPPTALYPCTPSKDPNVVHQAAALYFCRACSARRDTQLVNGARGPVSQEQKHTPLDKEAEELLSVWFAFARGCRRPLVMHTREWKCMCAAHGLGGSGSGGVGCGCCCGVVGEGAQGLCGREREELGLSDGHVLPDHRRRHNQCRHRRRSRTPAAGAGRVRFLRGSGARVS